MSASATTLEPARRAETEAAAGPIDQLDIRTRALLADLHQPRPVVYWLDMLGSAAVGWTAFVLAALPIPLWWMAAIVAALALYRGLCFTHEISHLRRRSVPGFETTWNLLLGAPLLLPSITYIGVHQSHHNLSTYGTKEDPEYLPFAHSRRLMVVFGLQSAFLLPILVALRFLVLAPLGLLWPRVHRFLEARASSFSMNPLYVRTVPAALARKMRVWELAILGVWSVPLALLAAGVLPARVAWLWLGVVTLISLLNTFRVLAAHEYESLGEPRDRRGQLQDSIDTPGGPWTELWAPVGLRYHALHHYFPGIPYHNLGLAYRRVVEELPEADRSSYRDSTSSSLWHSLARLYAAARRRGRALTTFWW